MRVRSVDDEEKKILPFLPFYDFKGNNIEKKITFNVQKLKMPNAEGPSSSKTLISDVKIKEEKAKKERNYSWKNVLRKLNKILRENRSSK